MTLTPDTRRRLDVALTSQTGADEVDGLLGGFMGAKVFYVHSGSGSNSYDGLSWVKPFATLAYAISQCTASVGDVIVLRPGHAETTTAVDISKIGVRVIGLGAGRNRPALTATTAATDLINVTAANVLLRNIRLVGAASGNTALIDVAAADFAGEGLVLEPLAIPLMSVTLAAGSVRGRFTKCVWRARTNGPDCAIDVETSDSDDWMIEDCVFDAASVGWDLGVIRANADAAVGWVIKNCEFISCDTVAIDFNSSAGATGVDGVVADCTFIATAALTSIEDIIDTGRYLFKECYAHDITNTTTAAARVPIGTVS
jgi:hypothetical protein